MNTEITRAYFVSEPEADFITSLEGCLDTIRKVTANGGRLIEQSFFIRTADTADYLRKKENIRERFLKEFNILPSTAVVGQPPSNGGCIAMELLIAGAGTDISFQSCSGIPYTVLEDDSGKSVYAAGIVADDPAVDIHLQTETCFSRLEGLLLQEEMHMGNIIRQWNYVENILSCYTKDQEEFQHYQVLNNIRSAYYAKYDFADGYPAATGIGTNAGGVILGIVAHRDRETGRIFPLHNPHQTDAYRYSDKVLVGSGKQTPKFERAKVQLFQDRVLVYISGTAAIHNESSLEKGDLAGQTKLTIDNIHSLIALAAIKSQTGIKLSAEEGVELQFLRVYIKPGEDFRVVENLLREIIPDVPLLLLEADVCRNDLLVEIEGVAVAKVSR